MMSPSNRLGDPVVQHLFELTKIGLAGTGKHKIYQYQYHSNQCGD